MSSTKLPIVQEVDEKLGRLACSVVLESSQGGQNRIGAEIMALAGKLVASPLPGLDRVISLLTAAAAQLADPAAVTERFAEIEAAWADWKVTTEAAEAAEAAAVGGSSEPVGPALPEAPPPCIPLDDGPGDEDLEILRTDPELTGMFIAEAIDHLGTIEATVLQLEANPGDQKLLNDVFRPFHTIKGNAGALGVKSVQEFAHKVENLLDKGRSGKINIGPPETDVILKSVDLLTTMINDLTPRLAGNPPVDVRVVKAELMATVQQLLEPGSAPAPAPLPAAPAIPPPRRQRPRRRTSHRSPRPGQAPRRQRRRSHLSLRRRALRPARPNPPQAVHRREAPHGVSARTRLVRR